MNHILRTHEPYLRNFQQEDERLGSSIRNLTPKEKRTFKEVMIVESMALGFSALGILALIVLAWMNF
jgi:hypothetical protein